MNWRSPSRSRTGAVALACLLPLAFGGCGDLGYQLAKPRGADLLETAATKPPEKVEGRFSLLDTAGRPVTEASFRDRPMLVYFGYTSCPEICGMELDTIAAAADEVGATRENLGLVFVTVDPRRDTPDRLEAFATHFHPQLVALRGDEVATARAARSFGLFRRVNDDDMGQASYTIDHSTFMYLFDAEGRFVRAFDYKTSPDVIAAELRKVMTT